MMNVQDFMASMMRDGFGGGMAEGSQQKGKVTDKTFLDMMEQMGMWMMMPSGMLQQTGENQGDIVPDGIGLVQETGAAGGLDVLNFGEQMPDKWNAYQEAGAVDNTVFLEKMALMSRQNGSFAENAGIQDLRGENLEQMTGKESKLFEMDMSGRQLVQEGADDRIKVMAPTEAAVPQTEAEDDGRAVIPLEDAGASGLAQEQTAEKEGKDINTEALSGTLSDGPVSFEPKLRTTEVHTEVPVYHHQVKQEADLGSDLSKLITGQVRAGQKEFEIQLEPHNLGKITIKVSNHDNQTTIALLCSEEKTLSLLAQNAKELGVIMENNLGVPAQILVDKQAPDYLNQENNQGGNAQKEQQKEKQKEKKHSGDGDFIQKLRLGMTSVSELQNIV